MGNRPAIRRHELDVVRPYLQGRRILELGGGTGFQASLMVAWGFDVSSIDVAVPEGAVFPVQRYDGRKIPFGDATFDMVFSSHVLEHVEDVTPLLLEVARVLKPAGRAIHVMPSVTWRVLTMSTHYLHLIRRLTGVFAKGRAAVAPEGQGQATSSRPLWRRALVAGPHGVFASAWEELFTFRKSRWVRVFDENGFAVEECIGSGVAYSGYAMMPWLSVSARGAASRIVGSSSSIFITRAQNAHD